MISEDISSQLVFWFLLFGGIGGCVELPEEQLPLKPSVMDTGGPVTGPTTSTGGTTSTTSTSSGGLYDYDCSAPNPPILSGGEVGSYGPAEDFDFDADGYAIQVFDSNLVARNKVGDETFVLATLSTSWTSGTRVLSTGDVLVADSENAEVVLVDAQTGSRATVFTQAGWPNGLEVDRDGFAYVSDFSSSGFVAKFDPYNPSDSDVIIPSMSLPNGIILSPDDQIMYIAGTNGEIIAVDRDASSGEWQDPRLLIDAGGAPQGIHVDICGNVYWTDGTTSVLRVRPDGTGVEVVAELNDAASGYLPNLRWGNGVGGWEVDHLYASDRFAEVMFDINVGIPGKKHVMYLP